MVLVYLPRVRDGRLGPAPNHGGHDNLRRIFRISWNKYPKFLTLQFGIHIGVKSESDAGAVWIVGNLRDNTSMSRGHSSSGRVYYFVI